MSRQAGAAEQAAVDHDPVSVESRALRIDDAGTLQDQSPADPGAPHQQLTVYVCIPAAQIALDHEAVGVKGGSTADVQACQINCAGHVSPCEPDRMRAAAICEAEEAVDAGVSQQHTRQP
ncbi:hypothetical protein ACIQWL_52190 [Streptomyces mirabilis]|uniref:hypothetical protein n=1 Tax=Streptomyces mirabilis TaxID=68239 RepID=UPI000765AA45